MSRELRSAAEIQAEVHNVLYSMAEVRTEGRAVTVPHPQMQAPDAQGCNWYMEYFGNVGALGSACLRAMQDVQARWNMRP